MVPLEERSIDDMQFEGGEPVRELLRSLGVKIAHDIELLGCTGAKAQGLTNDQITALRLSLAGGGVGLPCFVDINRFCLGHNTIGGLQEQQEQRHKEYVEAVSRELTKEERGRIELIEAARRKQGKTLNERLVSTTDILAGREMADGFEAEQDRVLPQAVRDGIEQARRGEVSPIPTHVLQDWECPEHKKTNWACRYCVAQAIVEGPLVPMTLIGVHGRTGPDGRTAVLPLPASTFTRVEDPNNVPAEIGKYDASGAHLVDVWVRVASFWRHLARTDVDDEPAKFESMLMQHFDKKGDS
jgi:hypothetical protein